MIGSQPFDTLAPTWKVSFLIELYSKVKFVQLIVISVEDRSHLQKIVSELISFYKIQDILNEIKNTDKAHQMLRQLLSYLDF